MQQSDGPADGQARLAVQALSWAYVPPDGSPPGGALDEMIRWGPQCIESTVALLAFRGGLGF